MTELLFRKDAYAREAIGKVVSITEEGGIVLDGSVFYPTSGGQPGDSGTLSWGDKSLQIATAVKGPEDKVILIPAEPAGLPGEGQAVTDGEVVARDVTGREGAATRKGLRALAKRERERKKNRERKRERNKHKRETESEAKKCIWKAYLFDISC